MDPDPDVELARLRDRVGDCVRRSRALEARVRARARLDGSTGPGPARGLDEGTGLPSAYGLPLAHGRGHAARALDQVLLKARQVFPGCGSIGVTVVVRHETIGRSSYVSAAGTGLAPTLDAAQHAFHEGPSLDAIALGRRGPVHVEDLADAEAVRAWPRFTPLARVYRVGSTLSIGIPSPRDALRRTTIGAITLYGPEAQAFAATAATHASFAAWVGSVLTGGHDCWAPDHTNRRQADPPRRTARYATPTA